MIYPFSALLEQLDDQNRIFLQKLQQYQRRSGRRPMAALPIADRSVRDIEHSGEFQLGHGQLSSNLSERASRLRFARHGACVRSFQFTFEVFK